MQIPTRTAYEERPSRIGPTLAGPPECGPVVDRGVRRGLQGLARSLGAVVVDPTTRIPASSRSLLSGQGSELNILAYRRDVGGSEVPARYQTERISQNLRSLDKPEQAPDEACHRSRH